MSAMCMCANQQTCIMLNTLSVCLSACLSVCPPSSGPHYVCHVHVWKATDMHHASLSERSVRPSVYLSACPHQVHTMCMCANQQTCMVLICQGSASVCLSVCPPSSQDMHHASLSVLSIHLSVCMSSFSERSVCMSVWVCETYVVHHLVGTGLCCAPPSCALLLLHLVAL